MEMTAEEKAGQFYRLSTITDAKGPTMDRIGDHLDQMYWQQQSLVMRMGHNADAIKKILPKSEWDKISSLFDRNRFYNRFYSLDVIRDWIKQHKSLARRKSPMVLLETSHKWCYFWEEPKHDIGEYIRNNIQTNTAKKSDLIQDEDITLFGGYDDPSFGRRYWGDVRTGDWSLARTNYTFIKCKSLAIAVLLKMHKP